MQVNRWLRLARMVGERGDLAQRGALTGIALAERLLGPVLVTVASSDGVAQGLTMGVALSSVFALRGLLQSTHLLRTQAGLYVRVVNSVLGQDVLQANVLPDEEAHATLFEGGQRVASLLADGVPNLCANVLAAAIFSALVVFTQSARIITVASIAGAIGICVLTFSRRAIDPAQRVESSAWVRLADGISDAFDGRLEIVAAGRREAYAERFARLASGWSTAAVRATRVSRLAGRLPLLGLTVFVGLSIVVDSILRGEQAGRTLGQAAFLASMAPAFVGIAQGLQELARGETRVRQVLALLTVDDSPPRPGMRHCEPVRSVDVRGVHFSYQGGAGRYEALRGMSFAWRAGEVLALAGSNASGKSTCLRVLLGLAIPSAGEVLVDGVALDRLDVEAWRRSIAFLPQRPYLPPRATVRECLRFIDPDASEEVMAAATKRVGLGHGLPGDPGPALDRRVDELSIGHKQRVALARLLCRSAPLVILDEPDANLDQEGVELVADLLRELSQGRMVIVAVHSPTLLAAADRVLTIESGRIAAESVRRSTG